LENVLLQEGSRHRNCEDVAVTSSPSWLLSADSSDGLPGKACDERLGCGEVWWVAMWARVGRTTATSKLSRGSGIAVPGLRTGLIVS